MLQSEDLLLLDFHGHLQLHNLLFLMITFTLHVVHDLVAGHFYLILEGCTFLLEQVALFAHFLGCLVRLEELLFDLGKFIGRNLQALLSFLGRDHLFTQLSIDSLQFCKPLLEL